MGRRNKSRGYARRNRGDFPSVDPKLNLSPEELQRGAQAFEDWHWGIGAHKVVDWDDNDMPPMLIECGRLIRLRGPSARRWPSVAALAAALRVRVRWLPAGAARLPRMR
jgi:hypothetical protein